MSAEEYISSLERGNEKLRVQGQKDHDTIERLRAENEALIEVLHENGITVDLSALKKQA